MKYYVYTDFDRKPLSLFRFENSPTEFFQEVWRPSEKSWVASETLGKMLIFGEVSLYDISLENAQKIFPDAFADSTEAPNDSSDAGA